MMKMLRFFAFPINCMEKIKSFCLIEPMPFYYSTCLSMAQITAIESRAKRYNFQSRRLTVDNTSRKQCLTTALHEDDLFFPH